MTNLTLEHLRGLSLETLLQQLGGNYRPQLLLFYSDFKSLIHTSKGAAHNHHTWAGGYGDHIAEVLRFHALYAQALRGEHGHLPFEPADAVVALFFHDIEKLFAYATRPHEEYTYWRKREDAGMPWKELRHEMQCHYLKRYGIEETPAIANALRYVHGEGADYRGNAPKASPIAAHVHHCDNTSARMFPNGGHNLSLPGIYEELPLPPSVLENAPGVEVDSRGVPQPKRWPRHPGFIEPKKW